MASITNFPVSCDFLLHRILVDKSGSERSGGPLEWRPVLAVPDNGSYPVLSAQLRFRSESGSAEAFGFGWFEAIGASTTPIYDRDDFRQFAKSLYLDTLYAFLRKAIASQAASMDLDFEIPKMAPHRDLEFLEVNVRSSKPDE